MHCFALRHVLACLAAVLCIELAFGNDVDIGSSEQIGNELPQIRDILPLAPNMPGFFESVRYQLLVDEVASSHGMDRQLLHAIVSVESRFNPNARSSSGAAGLMQLMPATARRYGVTDALDPEQNLRGGAKYFNDLLNMFGNDIRLALAAYHAGENAVAKYQNRIPPFRATINFVSKVMERYQKQRGQ